METKLNYHHILVTGGAGFIGSQLVRDLLTEGYSVTVLDDLSTGKIENLSECLENPHFKFIKGSITNSNDIEIALRNIDAVFHLAVSNLRVSISKPLLSNDVNATGTLNILLACAKNKINRFVYVSSSEIYGTAKVVPMSETHPTIPKTIYAASKLVGEYYTQVYQNMYGLNTTIVRPFNNYGPRSHWEKENGEIIPRSVVRLKMGLAPVIYGDGLQTRDFIYVTDTTRGLIQILKNPKTFGQTYNLAYGQEASIREICEKLCKLINPSIKPDFRAISRPGDVLRHYADNRKILIELNIKPSISLDEGLSLYLKWFENQKFNLSSLANEVQEVNW